MKPQTIIVDDLDFKSVTKAETKKRRLENNGWNLDKVERLGLHRWRFTYTKTNEQ